jgi:hypothetical protein
VRALSLAAIAACGSASLWTTGPVFDFVLRRNRYSTRAIGPVNGRNVFSGFEHAPLEPTGVTLEGAIGLAPVDNVFDSRLANDRTSRTAADRTFVTACSGLHPCVERAIRGGTRCSATPRGRDCLGSSAEVACGPQLRSAGRRKGRVAQSVFRARSVDQYHRTCTNGKFRTKFAVSPVPNGVTLANER